MLFVPVILLFALSAALTGIAGTEHTLPSSMEQDTSTVAALFFIPLFILIIIPLSFP